MDSESFAPDLTALLEPVSAEAPSGPSIRYEAAFLQLRQSREEDDPSVPMGEWERPLRKADWRAVAKSCSALLGRSKDFQIAAWLCDAWLRQHQIAGFRAGVNLLQGLVERYWDDVHPRIEDGDSEARTAAFAWLNESLPVALRLQVPLVFLPERKPAILNLDDWERVAAPVAGRDEDENPVTREALVAMVDAGGVRWLVQLQRDLGEALPQWEALDRALDERLGAQAPSLGKVADTLRRMQRACASLLNGRGEPQPGAAASVQEEEPESPPPRPAEPEEPIMSAESFAPAETTAAHALVTSGSIASRQQAYAMLEAAAAYLQRTEPHSPTPYLVKRAVAWGQLSLPDLMQEVLREEGDLNRFFSMLGISAPRD